MVPKHGTAAAHLSLRRRVKLAGQVLHPPGCDSQWGLNLGSISGLDFLRQWRWVAPEPRVSDDNSLEKLNHFCAASGSERVNWLTSVGELGQSFSSSQDVLASSPPPSATSVFSRGGRQQSTNSLFLYLVSRFFRYRYFTVLSFSHDSDFHFLHCCTNICTFFTLYIGKTCWFLLCLKDTKNICSKSKSLVIL